MKTLNLIFSVVCIGILAVGCGKKNKLDSNKTVVLYCALDQIFSEKIIHPFSKQEAIIKPVFDTEATKTVGLVNRIISEKNNPQCDVFWNNEIVRTIILKRKGLLQPYISPNATNIPKLNIKLSSAPLLIC